MRFAAVFFVIAMVAFSLPATAQTGPEFAGRQTLGVGRLFTNDYLGDGNDRWRTGSYVLSVVRGPEWTGALPAQPGRILEYRFRNEIIAPGRLNGPGSDDRPYVGLLAWGVHSHHALGAVEYSLGVDIVAVGPQTGIGDVHAWFHEEVDAPRVGVLDDQIGDAVSWLATAEYAHSLKMGESAVLRPFLEVQAGVEDLLRVGADLVFGPVAGGGLLLRDIPTGQLYPGIRSGAGLSFIAGADWARVMESDWLPSRGGFLATEDRMRARAGVNWQSAGSASFFYGLTWLSPEFEGQEEGQLLGSVTLRILF
jgi:hypothetical protein